MKTFIYTHSQGDKGRLVEKITMNKPISHPSNFEPGSYQYQFYYSEWDRYNEHVASLTDYPTLGFSKADEGEVSEDRFKVFYRCPACGGDGKETCSNPDHGFIKGIPGEIGRLGCPVCGHDPDHKVNRGRNTCPECRGIGHMLPEVFEEYVREYGYEKEPQPIAIPVEPADQPSTQERMFTLNEVEILIADFAKQYRSAPNPDLMNDVAEFLEERI